VALPEWINDATPDIDTNVWSKKIETYTYTMRLSDAMKWTIDQILLNHALVLWVDDTRNFIVSPRSAWLRKIDAAYEGDINFARPWKVTIELVVEGETYIAFLPEAMGWAYCKREGEIWFNEEYGGYLGYECYFPTITGLQGGGYFESQAGV
jgi:hypothetical protein